MKAASAAESFGHTLMQLYEQIEGDTFIMFLLLLQRFPFKDNGEVRGRVGVSITQIKATKVAFGEAVTFQERSVNENCN